MEMDIGTVLFQWSARSDRSGRSFRLRPEKNGQIVSDWVWPMKKNGLIRNITDLRR